MQQQQQRKISRFLPFIFIFHLAFFCTVHTVFAAPVQLKLNTDKSSARVDVVTTMVSTNATLKRMSGFLTITGDAPEDFEVNVSASGDDVALGTLPIDQMILVSGLLRSVVNKEVSFKSTQISKNGNTYLIKGIATSGRNRDEITVPAIITGTTNKRIIEAQHNHSGFIGGDNNQLGKMFGKVQAKSKLNLVFSE